MYVMTQLVKIIFLWTCYENFRVFTDHKEMKSLYRFGKGLETASQMKNNKMLKLHGEKLFNSIDLAVNTLDDLETLVPVLVQMGYSHYTWGVRENHFGVKLFSQFSSFLIIVRF